MMEVDKLPFLSRSGTISFAKLCQTHPTMPDFNSSTVRALTSLSNGISGTCNPYGGFVDEASPPNASTRPIYK